MLINIGKILSIKFEKYRLIFFISLVVFAASFLITYISPNSKPTGWQYAEILAPKPLLKTVLSQKSIRNLDTSSIKVLKIPSGSAGNLYIFDYRSSQLCGTNGCLYSFPFFSSANPSLYVPDAQRGIAVIGAAGSGKTLFIFNPQDTESAKLFSDYLGEMEIKFNSKSRSTGKGGGSRSSNEHHQKRHLLEPSQFAKMGTGRAVIINPAYTRGNEAYVPLLQAMKVPKSDIEEMNWSESKWDFVRARLIESNGIQISDEISGLSGELLNPQLIIQLQQLRSTPVGEVVEGAINKRVELDGKVVLQSDKDGRVIVNELLQKEIVQDIDLENVEGFKSTETNHNSEEIIYPEFSSIEDNLIDNTKAQVPGSIRVAESLNTLEDSPLKTLLNAELEQLRSEIKALQQEHNLYQELIQQRLQQPQNISWWQELKNKTSIVINSFTSTVKIGIREYQNNSTQHQFAASIKNLFHLQTQPGENHYQTDNYQISRSGSLYEIKESATNKQIMQFQVTPLGLRVERSNLEKYHISDLTTLQTSLQRNESVPASFAPVGKQEAEYFARVERITNVLVQYAVTQQKKITIDGAFSYKWQANSNGDVQIEAKDGRGNLLEKTGGSIKSNMSERDLVYFEQILPKLQASSQKEAVNYLKSTNHQER